jgi:D-aminoacyl-tRNA deacylase
MKLILYSMDDLAGSNIAKSIIKKYGFQATGEDYSGSPIYRNNNVLLTESPTNVKDLNNLPYAPEVCIVASRHKSESGKPTLTCHPTGNYSTAELGGSSSTLQLTEARYLRQSLTLLKSLKIKHNLTYEVSMEVTHHGPTDLPFPLLFVEVGSTEQQWKDEKACDTAAEVIHETIFNGVEDKPTAIGFGEPHYAPNFNETTDHYAIGHIMPKHAIPYLTKTMVHQMIEKTQPRPQTAIIDWKGLKGAERDTLLEILKELEINWVKTSAIK